MLTRLNGPEFALNPDLIERAESTPDTVITLVDGAKYVVLERLDEVVDLIRASRALALAEAAALQGLATAARDLTARPERPHPPAEPVASEASVVPFRRNS